MSEVGSSVPRRQLGRLLRQARQEAGINLQAAAEALEWSRAKMYRLESGQTSLRTHDVVLICQLYGTPKELTDVLVSLALESKAKAWWHAYDGVIPSWFELYVGLEAAAAHIRNYEPALIPGLLQTPEYATVIFQAKPGRSPEEMARKVALRMERQRLLARQRPAAPRFEAIIDEAVLRRPIADTEAWRRQLAHLVNGTQPANTSLRVLPSSVGPHGASVAGAFVIMDYPAIGTRPADPSTVYCESLTGALYLDKSTELETYTDAWCMLENLALDRRASEDLIATVIKETFDD
ncbi:helix-turn-helix domain-containing protein [Micromonospora zhanjiangensis]|uniref:Helix-turn-helix domain-containing protein n=1 Tax=Micromonospora zhanjiangensis TaxID=1522057 RepID=A0ABV8KHW3_9ACTN